MDLYTQPFVLLFYCLCMYFNYVFNYFNDVLGVLILVVLILMVLKCGFNNVCYKPLVALVALLREER